MSGRRGAERPTLYTIPPGAPFVDALARGVLSGRVVPLDRADPLALSGVTILLPTRRACRALGDAFLRRSPGKALLLPRIQPLGDIDDDEAGLGDEGADPPPPAIPPLTRRLLLARLVLQLGETPGGAALAGAGAVDHATRLARALATLLDEMQIARVDPQGLRTLVPEEYAAHWQRVLTFLSLIVERWPAILAEREAMDPYARGNAVLARLAARWEAAPPAHPVIAAGSTGSVPATRDLLATVARLPRGCVVFPGLDMVADAETWEAIGPTHPQYALKRLLARLGRRAAPSCPGRRRPAPGPSPVPACSPTPCARRRRSPAGARCPGPMRTPRAASTASTARVCGKKPGSSRWSCAARWRRPAAPPPWSRRTARSPAGSPRSCAAGGSRWTIRAARRWETRRPAPSCA